MIYAGLSNVGLVMQVHITKQHINNTYGTAIIVEYPEIVIFPETTEPNTFREKIIYLHTSYDINAKSQNCQSHELISLL